MKLSSLLSSLVPTLTILIIIMASSGLHVGGYPLLPASYLAAVFYWAIFYPQALPLGSLLLIGLFYDALLGHDIGLSSALLIVSSLLAQRFRPLLLSYNFLVVWGAFCIYSFCYICLYIFILQGYITPLFSWGYGVLTYPIIAWILGHLHSRLHFHV